MTTTHVQGFSIPLKHFMSSLRTFTLIIMNLKIIFITIYLTVIFAKSNCRAYIVFMLIIYNHWNICSLIKIILIDCCTWTFLIDNNYTLQNVVIFQACAKCTVVHLGLFEFVGNERQQGLKFVHLCVQLSCFVLGLSLLSLFPLGCRSLPLM